MNSRRRFSMGAGWTRQSGKLLHDTITCRKTVLSSGVRIVSESIPWVRSLALGFWFDTGTRDEAPEKSGIAHFIEHAVFKGTTRRKTHQIAQYLESVGGYLNAFTTKDATCYYARILSQHLGRAVEILSDICIHPTFIEREMEKEKRVIIEEMRAAEDDPEDTLHDLFEKTLFGSHPLGQPVVGTEEAILSLSKEDLHSFISKEYTGQHLVVAAAGDVDHDLLIQYCMKALGTIPQGTQRKRTKPRIRSPREDERSKQVQQAHCIIGRQVMGIRDDRNFELMLLNAVLGEGMSSRLFQRVRERHGYAYNVYSFTSLYEDTGAFGVFVSSDRSKLSECLDIIASELSHLESQPVSRRELNRAREQTIGSFLIGLESMTARMTRLGKDELIFRRSIPIDEVIARLERADESMVHTICREVLRLQDWSSTSILPGD